jgi:hypothetical protein
MDSRRMKTRQTDRHYSHADLLEQDAIFFIPTRERLAVAG